MIITSDNVDNIKISKYHYKITLNIIITKLYLKLKLDFHNKISSLKIIYNGKTCKYVNRSLIFILTYIIIHSVLIYLRIDMYK